MVRSQTSNGIVSVCWTLVVPALFTRTSRPSADATSSMELDTPSGLVMSTFFHSSRLERPCDLERDIRDLRTFPHRHRGAEGLLEVFAHSDHSMVRQQDRPISTKPLGDVVAGVRLRRWHVMHHAHSPA